jgi:hypothetical protein
MATSTIVAVIDLLIMIDLPVARQSKARALLLDHAGDERCTDYFNRWPGAFHGKFGAPMSTLCHKRTLGEVRIMSALPPKADIAESDFHALNVGN